MTTPPKYSPRSGDLAKTDILKLAEDAKKRYAPHEVHVFFKCTCPNCGERLAFEEPDTLYESATCENCHTTSDIHFFGFRLEIRV